MHPPQEENPHKLSLALEPECAAMYCRQLKNDQFADYSDKPASPSTESYMVCDIGGGTVDITAFKHCEDSTEVIIPPMGNDSGGRKVNERFSDFLANLVRDPNFTTFLQRRRMHHRSILALMISHDFEEQKQAFERDASDAPDENSLKLVLNHRFVDHYRGKILQGVHTDPQVTFDEVSNALAIHYSKVKELFQPVMEEVIQCSKDALQKVEEEVDMIYLVGGVGGSRYTYSKLRPVIKSLDPFRTPFLIVPKDHTLAVSQGAVLYRRNLACIKARRMDATYGIGCTQRFNNGIHDEHYAQFDPDDHSKLCGNVFLVFVKNGERVTITDRFVGTLTPHSQKDTTTTFMFYRTTKDNVQYIKDKRGKYNVEKIGFLTLTNLTNPNRLPKHQRTMEVTMNFSSTEIKVQAQATYLPDRPSVKAVFDFL